MVLQLVQVPCRAPHTVQLPAAEQMHGRRRRYDAATAFSAAPTPAAELLRCEIVLVQKFKKRFEDWI